VCLEFLEELFGRHDLIIGCESKGTR